MDSDKPLTPTMKRCLDYLTKKIKLVRYPGGYWAEEYWHRWKTPWYGTSTIEALVSRGLAVYTEWKPGRAGDFPVEVMLPITITTDPGIVWKVGGA